MKCKEIQYFGAQLKPELQFAVQPGDTQPEPQWAADPADGQWYLFILGSTCHNLEKIWSWDPESGWQCVEVTGNTAICLYASVLVNEDAQILPKPWGVIWVHPGARYIFGTSLAPLVCPPRTLLLESNRSVVLESQENHHDCHQNIRWVIRCSLETCRIIDLDGDTFVSVCQNNFVDIQAQNGLVARFDPLDQTGGLPVEGPGTRLMYSTFKGALRSGRVDNGQWDDSNVGQYSTAFGLNTQATGEGALASGRALNPSKISSAGAGSVAIGFSATDGEINSNGSGSIGLGHATGGGVFNITGSGSFGVGYVESQGSEISASNQASLVMGHASNGSALKSVGIGSSVLGRAIEGGTVESRASGSHAVGSSSGQNSIILASADGTVAMGQALGDDSKLMSGGFGSLAVGGVFSGGLIESRGSGSQAMGYSSNEGSETVASANGSFAAGYTLDGGKITSQGLGSRAMGSSQGQGSQILASNAGSLALGNAETGGVIESSSLGSHAVGYSLTSGKILASGDGSSAMGAATIDGELTSQGIGSFAHGLVFGTGGKVTSVGSGSTSMGFAFGGEIVATGDGSFAAGRNLTGDRTEATALGSIALGRSVKNDGAGLNVNSMIIGQYGVAKTSSVGVQTIQGEASLQIAGGADNTSTDGISVVIGTSAFSNAAPTGGGNADFWQTTGADYAEYFEWATGTDTTQNLVAYFVELTEGNKIRLAQGSDSVIGVTTKMGTGFIGDSAELRWCDALARDDFGHAQTRLSYRGPLLSSVQIKIIGTMAEIAALRSHTSNADSSDPLAEQQSPEVKEKLAALETSLGQLNQALAQVQKTDQPDDETLVAAIEKFVPDLQVRPVVVNVLNPQYDPSLPYVPRAARPEWIPVGLLGKLIVRASPEVQVGQKCDCLNGVAVPGSKWHVLQRMNDKAVKILKI